MRLSGIHLLLTYKCNAACRHCFLNCGPSKNGLLSIDQVRRYLDDADRMNGGAYFFVEGGEPFLYREHLEQVIREISGRGYWVGALTNGFWATSSSKAREVLRPMAEAGLGTLGISADDFHFEYVDQKVALRAAKVAAEMGLEGSILTCGPADLACRGRASNSTLQCSASGYLTPEACTDCSERLDDPSRVHIGPGGEIHLCQGLLLGESAEERSLREILEDYEPERHPIAAPLLRGGPAELARQAQASGFSPSRDRYADSCQLCYEVRSFLRDSYPDHIGPAQVYPA